MEDILSALEIEWMKREAERMDKQIRDILKSSGKEETNDTRK